MSALNFQGVLLFAGVATVLAATAATAAEKPSNDTRAKRFVEYYETTIRPIEIETNRLWWTANVTGKEEDFRKKQTAEEKLDLRLADPERFAELKAIKTAGVADPLLARQIDVLYLEFLEKQVPVELLKKISAKSNVIERAFNVFRPKVDGKELTDNDVRQVLIESGDSARRKAVWEASKKVGSAVVANLLDLVELRNEAARKLGFADFFAMRLYLGEQDERQLFKLFDELEVLTREPFGRAKAEIDAALAASYGITVDELRPWHYHDPFFQEAPVVEGALPNAIFKNLDIVGLDRSFYAGIGLPVDDVLARSDLFEKPGKNPHAFCEDLDRAGDVRLFENIVPNEEWLGTTLHESGHAVYDKNVGAGLPYVLHTDAHPLCTEGVAMMFERFTHNVDWLRAMGVRVPDADRYRAAAAKLQRYRLLIFARYCQTIVHFERELYRNPKQDLNKLWWDLAEKYQGLKRPEGRNEPDFAAKYHIIGAPVYYHNYMLGEMFASQVHHALVRAVLPGVKPAGAIYVGNRAAGEFLRERVFSPGLTLKWDDLTRHATGEDLGPKAFAEDIESAD